MPEEITMDQIVPEEFKGNTVLQDIKDPAALVKGFIHAQKLIGERVLPAEGDPQDKFDAVHSKMGWPATKEEYKIEFVSKEEKHKPIQDKFVNIFHENRLTGKQAQNVGKSLEATLAEMAVANSDLAKKSDETFEAKLNSIYGDDKDKVTARVNGALDSFIPTELKEDFAKLDANTKSAFNIVVDNFLKEYGGEDYMALRKLGSASHAGSLPELQKEKSIIQKALFGLQVGSEEHALKAREFADINKTIESSGK